MIVFTLGERGWGVEEDTIFLKKETLRKGVLENLFKNKIYQNKNFRIRVKNEIKEVSEK